MKTITSIYHRTFAFAYVLLVAVLLSSCSDIFPTDERFIIIKVESTKRGEYKYQMSSVKGIAGFSMKSETLYQKGDTLVLGLNCHQRTRLDVAGPSQTFKQRNDEDDRDRPIQSL